MMNRVVCALAVVLYVLTGCSIGPTMGADYVQSNPQLSEKTKRAVKAHAVYVGMSADHIVAALGKATRINVRATAQGTTRQWVFTDINGLSQAYVYTRGGVVVEVQEMGRRIRYQPQR